MKKIFLLMFLLVLCGCNIIDMDNTPKKQVEKYFNNYQTLDKEVLKSIDTIVSNQISLTAEQKKIYKDIIKNHYEKLDYEIKDETINGDNATVRVEIEVYDYSDTIRKVEEHKVQFIEEFYDNTNNYNDSIFQDYRLKALKETKDRVKYTLYIGVTKINDKWIVDNLSNIDEEKILGIYEY